ncbi:uncharacterized protein [Struthio camelus]|uniref:uncharacterized protein isoform X7 n=1 Tax=Struthio camelus TaxID=8801 RepID=UPI003603FFEB
MSLLSWGAQNWTQSSRRVFWLDACMTLFHSRFLNPTNIARTFWESIPVTALKPSQTSEQKIGNSYYRLRQALPMQLYLRQRKTSTHKWLDNHTEFVSQKSTTKHYHFKASHILVIGEKTAISHKGTSSS